MALVMPPYTTIVSYLHFNIFENVVAKKSERVCGVLFLAAFLLKQHANEGGAGRGEKLTSSGLRFKKYTH